MKIGQITINNYDQIMLISEDGTNQLVEHEVGQWQGEYSSPDQVREDIGENFAYLAVSVDGETVGVISIVEAPDHSHDSLKGKWLLNTDKYVVTHRVVIHSKHAGHGYTTKLLTEVADYICNSRKDIDGIRIDIHENSTAMQHLIGKVDFNKVGELYGAYRPDEISHAYEDVRE